MISRVLLWLVGAFILTPIVATAVAATSVDFSRGPWGSGVTADWLAAAAIALAPVLGRSLVIAFLVVAVDLVLAVVLSWWLARHPSWLTHLVGYALNVPMAVPGIALSVALVSAYPALRPSGALLVAAHIVFTLPFAVAALKPVLAAPALRGDEEVAATLGASPTRIAATVTAPALALAAAQSASMIFALSFGEFNLSFFVNPPATPTVPFALFDAYSTQRLEYASAQTTIFIAVIAPILALIALARRASTRSRT